MLVAVHLRHIILVLRGGIAVLVLVRIPHVEALQLLALFRIHTILSSASVMRLMLWQLACRDQLSASRTGAKWQ